MTQTITKQRSSEQTADKNAIRPFHVNIPEAELADLRQRLAQTRLPEKETVTSSCSKPTRTNLCLTAIRAWAERIQR